ncbi:hypothetical protein [Bacillus wiedmannii]|uniref:hypothetical protein n=1 Tax=Bacillus wiedmannii TaxID=1890302 RepID=UPI000CD98488|nr:hypothetical protein [Bacillus wiedmannii]MBG9829692.1 hypothetical protein [Bacillus wiedmannii]UOB95768.1 hypothetical protein BTI679_31110 [Bacillus wiedmannii]
MKHISSLDLTPEYAKENSFFTKKDNEIVSVLSFTDRGIGLGAQDAYRDNVAITLTDEEALELAQKLIDTVESREEEGIVYEVK